MPHSRKQSQVFYFFLSTLKDLDVQHTREELRDFYLLT